MVTLILDSKPTSFVCYMGDFGCGGGGWTPVMKIDGSKVYLSNVYGSESILITWIANKSKIRS